MIDLYFYRVDILFLHSFIDKKLISLYLMIHNQHDKRVTNQINTS
jgi:hypothetical protein